MANNQNTITFGLSFMQMLITFLGTRKTGMTGAQKLETVVGAVAPLLPVAATIASNNQNDPIHKAEVAALAQGLHDTLTAGGVIAETSALEAGANEPVAPPQTVKEMAS